MVKSGWAAAARMHKWSKEGRTGVAGYCLKICREAWNLPPDEISAIKEWESIPPRHRHKVRWALIPIGYPVFFEGGEFGHVAIQSQFPGFVWSTDAPTKDRIGLVHVSFFRRKWRYRYLGYSTQFQNRTLP